LAGLLLGDYNVLVLDEPGNHLDVDTVEALAEALIEYQGTVIFTSHDRHFMRRVSTSVIEIRDGIVKNFGGYDSYLYAVEKELSAHAGAATPARKPAASHKPSVDHRQQERDDRKLRKELATIERKIAQLDEQRKSLNGQLMKATDPQEALRLHEELSRVTTELATIEERWLALQSSLD
jgi:ATP-binding cassette subfamily F protein 3